MGDILSDRDGLSLTELEGLMITDPGVIEAVGVTVGVRDRDPAVIEAVGLADPIGDRDPAVIEEVGLADPDGVTVGVREPVGLGVRDAVILTE